MKRRGPPVVAMRPAKVSRLSSGSVAMSVLQQYHQLGRLDMTVFDEGIVKDLDALGPDGITQALNLYCEVEPASIRNHAGFLKGIILKVRTPFPSSRSVLPAARPGSTAIRPSRADTYWTFLKKHHDAGQIDMNQLDANIMADLEALPKELSLKAAECFCTADLVNVRNPCGFMKGIINSVSKVPAEDDASNVQLSSMVQLHLDNAIAKGLIHAHQVDVGIRASLADLDPKAAIRVLADFTMTDPATVMNKPGYLMSLIKKQQIKDRKAASHPRAQGDSRILDELQELHEQGKLDMTEFDGAILRDLENLPYEQATKALDSFMSADHSHIRNRMAFLKGIINLLRHGPKKTEALEADLDPSVQSQLDVAITNGYITEEQCDSALLASLAAFDPDTAMQILAEFMEAEPDSVQNKAGFLCSIMKRHRPRPGRASGGRQMMSDGEINALLVKYQNKGLDIGKLDERIVRDLQELGAHGADHALRQLSTADVANIRNVPGFLKGIINKLKREGLRLEPPVATFAPVRSSTSLSTFAPRVVMPSMGLAPARRPSVPAAVAGVAPGALQSAMIFCPSCGLEQPQLNFCSNCGFSLGNYVGTLR